MGLRGWLKRLEREARGEMVSFELLDGRRYYHDPTAGELFLHFYECATGGNPDTWPEAPEVIRKVTEARDPQAALESVSLPGSYFDIFPYDPEVLVRERRIVPRSLVAGRDVYDQEVEDLSEP
jgi:hypothetical protein